MKKLPLGMILSCSILLSVVFSDNAYAQCVEDKDWPQKPCNYVIDTGNPNQKPILGDKQD
ncbi:MAG: hypothetical protein LV477_04220 [Candidatus Nitrosotalea sp.]|nr:hypothetical protein [Candidatus Nitrosotalea sp.]